MAGSQNIGESSDNPVAINVTAMVDVIFCLCIFFMCSFKFKQLEGKIESWLPRGAAAIAGPKTEELLMEIKVILRWEAGSGQTTRRVGNTLVDSDQQLMEKIKTMGASYLSAGKPDYPVILQPSRAVPWRDVVHVMDQCKQGHIERIEFSPEAE